ncbi:hypothetical protein KP509_34G071500 [Ceratopteris richardii]|uniref:Uncharacterized protein n=1 Tax=Ceratopteris richardii TaxID=49495 RepID=A0A8T2QNC3_CERRI|nr:hypothetical protein KP509_34G071500 [Ceratopteris richardii]KAH7284812.1 hypothetical protein KP509_34G071500 [Ceratopteris richardii]
MGRRQRKRSKVLCAKAMAWAGVISTVLSAAVYLGDFITTIMTLRAYYHYQFICPHALPSSFRNDSVCRAVHLHPSLYNLGIIFWYSFGWFVLGHLSYAVVFYYFFHRHIARIAFFMPLVQLYRLLCILRRTCNTERLNEFYERQKRLNSLYTFLVVALESAPQFGLQFFIAVSLGQYVRGSNDTDSQAQKLPKTLVISVILSFASVIYNAGVAMYSCLDHHQIPLIKRLSLTFVFGLQTVISVFEHMISVLALFPHDTHSPLTFPISVLLFTEIMLLFVFSSIVIQRHDQHEGKRMCTKFMQAIGLTLVMIWTGPSYMLILMQKSKAYVICGAFFRFIMSMESWCRDGMLKPSLVSEKQHYPQLICETFC